MIKPNKRTLFLIALLGPGLLASCQQESKNQKKEKQVLSTPITMEISKSIFGKIDGKDVYAFQLRNSEGFEVELLEFGAIITRIMMPDKTGVVEDVVLGYDDLQGYIDDPYYFGATIGRVANRIGGAKIALGAQEYELAPNTLPDFGHNGLHGGKKGFNKMHWKGKEFNDESGVGVVFEYSSPDGEEGYPGKVDCKVKYTLNSEQELQIDFQAITDQLTVVNMTHHSYFNLAGAGKRHRTGTQCEDQGR